MKSPGISTGARRPNQELILFYCLLAFSSSVIYQIYVSKSPKPNLGTNPYFWGYFVKGVYSTILLNSIKKISKSNKKHQIKRSNDTFWALYLQSKITKVNFSLQQCNIAHIRSNMVKITPKKRWNVEKGTFVTKGFSNLF